MPVYDGFLVKDWRSLPGLERYGHGGGDLDDGSAIDDCDINSPPRSRSLGCHVEVLTKHARGD